VKVVSRMGALVTREREYVSELESGEQVFVWRVHHGGANRRVAYRMSMQFGVADFLAFVEQVCRKVSLSSGSALEPEAGEQRRIVIIVFHSIRATIWARVPTIGDRKLPIMIDVKLEILSGFGEVRPYVELPDSESAGKGCCIRAGQLVPHHDFEGECSCLSDCLELVIWNTVAGLQISDLAGLELRGSAIVLYPGPAAWHEEFDRELAARRKRSEHIEFDSGRPAPGILILVIDDNGPMPYR